MYRKNLSKILSVLVIAICLISVLTAMFMTDSARADSYEGDTTGDIVVSVTVYDNEQPMDSATVDLMNSNNTIVDSGTTDNGTVILYTNQTLENGTIRVGHEDLDDNQNKGINATLPADPTNDTAYYSYTIQTGTDYSEEAKGWTADHPYISAGLGVFGILIIVGVAAQYSQKKNY